MQALLHFQFWNGLLLGKVWGQMKTSWKQTRHQRHLQHRGVRNSFVLSADTYQTCCRTNLLWVRQKIKVCIHHTDRKCIETSSTIPPCKPAVCPRHCLSHQLSSGPGLRKCYFSPPSVFTNTWGTQRQCVRNTKETARHPPGFCGNVTARCIRGDIFGKVWAARACSCALRNSYANMNSSTRSRRCGSREWKIRFLWSFSLIWFHSGQAQALEVQTDSTHISKVGQQVEGEEGLHVRGGLGPARCQTSQLWQNAVTCIT